VNDVPGGAQLVGEGPDPGGETQDVVEQHDFGHGFLLVSSIDPKFWNNRER
jgi:hypothetical protein